MKIAIRQCDLTPQRPCWQAGYVQREHFFDKVHDPIKATVFGLNINGQKLVFVGVDVSGVQVDLANAIVQRVNNKGIPLTQKDIIFGASHTHSGPLVGSYNNRELDPEYIELFTETLATQVVQAIKDDGQDATVKYSKATIDGLYSNRNDKNKLSDKDVHLLGFFAEEKLLGIFYTMAHHCTVLGPNFTELSADLFGELRRLLEKEYEVPVLMAQGNAGDMGNKQYRLSNLFDEVQREAAALADQIAKKRTDWEPLNILTMDYLSGEYEAVYDVDASIYEVKKAEFEDALKIETNFDTVKLLVTGINSFERKIKMGSRHVEKKMPFEIYTLGDLQVVAVPGELGSILGLRIKASSKAKVCLVWAYTDPCDLGYMIEKEAYGGFSQESNVTDYPPGISDEYVAAIIRKL